MLQPRLSDFAQVISTSNNSAEAASQNAAGTSFCGFFGHLLGFKQLARGLHAR
jgi:hypothetical protein